MNDTTPESPESTSGCKRALEEFLQDRWSAVRICGCLGIMIAVKHFTQNEAFTLAAGVSSLFGTHLAKSVASRIFHKGKLED